MDTRIPAPRRALVTGGAGFVGSHVVDLLIGSGYAVDVIDDLSFGKRENLASGIPLHVQDVASPEARALVQSGKYSLLAHLGALMDVRASVVDPMGFAHANVLGTINLLEGARALPAEQRPRVVFASTGGAYYGDLAPFPTAEDSEASPDSPYGVSKLACEYYLAYYARVFGVQVTSLRFGNVYGPRQDPLGAAGVVGIFIGRLLDGQPITVYGDGSQTRDYIYVSDIADAFVTAAHAPPPAPGTVPSMAFNIGTGQSISILQLVQAIAKVMGVEPDIRFAPHRTGEAAQSMLDPAKARRVLGVRAKVGLEEGLRRTVEWVRQSRAKS